MKAVYINSSKSEKERSRKANKQESWEKQKSKRAKSIKNKLLLIVPVLVNHWILQINYLAFLDKK